MQHLWEVSEYEDSSELHRIGKWRMCTRCGVTQTLKREHEFGQRRWMPMVGACKSETTMSEDPKKHLTVGVMIDSWKLSIFEKHLKAAGFQYTQHNGITSDTLLLKVVAKSKAAHEKIGPTIKAATLEAYKQRGMN